MELGCSVVSLHNNFIAALFSNIVQKVNDEFTQRLKERNFMEHVYNFNYSNWNSLSVTEQSAHLQSLLNYTTGKGKPGRESSPATFMTANIELNFHDRNAIRNTLQLHTKL